MMVYRKSKDGKVLEIVEVLDCNGGRITYMAGATRMQRYCDVDAGEYYTDKLDEASPTTTADVDAALDIIQGVG